MSNPPSPAAPAPTPFGPGDTSVPNPPVLQQRVAGARTRLQHAYTEISRRRFGESVPPPVTRADGLWPFLLIRSYPGDVGQRPQPPTSRADEWWDSPDVFWVPAGLGTDTVVSDRAAMAALVAQQHYEITIGVTYDIWVHVWNLARTPATGVRVRTRLYWIYYEQGASSSGQTPTTYLGGVAFNLAERTHSMVKAATFTPNPANPTTTDWASVLTATADCFSDPAPDNLPPVVDRHCASRAAGALSGPP